MAARTTQARSPTTSWWRSIRSSSPDVGRMSGASRSCDQQVAPAQPKNETVPTTVSTALADRIVRHTEASDSELNHRKSA